MDKFPEVGLVEKSFIRCLSKEGFMAQFYFELCNIHPTAYCHLSGPDLETYKNNLLSILKGILEFGKGRTTSLNQLSNLESGITKDTIMYWIQALLISVAANDEQLNQETSDAWRSLVKSGLEYILKQRNSKIAA